MSTFRLLYLFDGSFCSLKLSEAKLLLLREELLQAFDRTRLSQANLRNLYKIITTIVAQFMTINFPD